MKICPNRIKGFYRASNAIDRRKIVFLLFESSEQSIPNNKYPAIILIYVFLILSMMNSVIGRRNEK